MWKLENLGDFDGVAVHAHDSDGVYTSRRRVLRLGLTCLSGAFLAGCSASRGPSGTPRGVARGPEQLGPDEFIYALRPLAAALIAEADPDEERYLERAQGLLRRLAPPSPWRPLQPEEGWGADTITYFPPIVLLHIVMAPNSVIELHDHRHYNGILAGVSGLASVQCFDIVEGAGGAPGSDVVLRETRNAQLTRGALSSLSRRRENVHRVVAGPEGAHLIDLFTHFRPDARSHDIEWDGVPFDTDAKLFRAAWGA